MVKMGKALCRRIKEADIIEKILAVLGALVATFIGAVVVFWLAFILFWLVTGKGPMLD